MGERLDHKIKMSCEIKIVERSFQKTLFIHQKEERSLLPIRPIWAPFIFCPSFLYLIKLQMRSNNSSQYTMDWDHYIFVMISSILPIYLFISSSSSSSLLNEIINHLLYPTICIFHLYHPIPQLHLVLHYIQTKPKSLHTFFDSSTLHYQMKTLQFTFIRSESINLNFTLKFIIRVKW